MDKPCEPEFEDVIAALRERVKRAADECDIPLIEDEEEVFANLLFLILDDMRQEEKQATERNT